MPYKNSNNKMYLYPIQEVIEELARKRNMWTFGITECCRDDISKLMIKFVEPYRPAFLTNLLKQYQYREGDRLGNFIMLQAVASGKSLLDVSIEKDENGVRLTDEQIDE